VSGWNEIGRRARWSCLAAVLLLAAGCHGTPGTAQTSAGGPTAGAGTSPAATSARPSPSAAATSPAPGSALAVVTNPDAAPCVGANPPARWQHVIWIWFENKPDAAVLGSAQAPYLNLLARQCASAADYHGVTHPSLPNYLAATSGSTHGVRDDAGPAAHPLDGPSLFGQVASAGLEWRSYEEGMPKPCAPSPQGRYAVKHNPAAYYTALRAQCAQWDVPLDALAADVAAGTLPAFAFVTPDLCDDTHDCPVATGDRWLQQVLPTILRSPAYADGTTAVFVTYDEDDTAHGNRVPFVAVAPSVAAGAVLHAPADHYALLRTTESMLGLPALGAAASASVLPGF
jgi:phosphatidylinositol-3-phosphatase